MCKYEERERLVLLWQLYRTSLPERELRNITPMDFCSTECPPSKKADTRAYLLSLPREIEIRANKKKCSRMQHIFKIIDIGLYKVHSFGRNFVKGSGHFE